MQNPQIFRSTPMAISSDVVLIVIDLQKNGLLSNADRGINLMSGFDAVVANASLVVDAARKNGVPVIFTMEAHRPDLVDIGRELDGSEGVHCLEDDPMTEIADELQRRPEESLVKKRRYSIFFGTDLEILLRGYGATTLVLLGALTDVCVHYSFVDAHQNGYRTFVVEDCVIGSSPTAQRAALDAMEYLQRDSLVNSEEVISKILVR